MHETWSNETIRRKNFTSEWGTNVVKGFLIKTPFKLDFRLIIDKQDHTHTHKTLKICTSNEIIDQTKEKLIG